MEFGRSDIVGHLHRLGVRPGSVLLVHTSFRAVRPVAGGPQGLIDALQEALGPDGTLVMPCWSSNDDEPYDAAATPAASDLGIVAETFWRRSGVRRSTHVFAFAAAGPHADTITADPLPLPPHIPQSPVGRVHDLEGHILLLGVGHDANTTVHLAEVLAQVPYSVPRHCTTLQDGRPVRIEYRETDHCCQGFTQLDEWLRARGLQADGRVGHADARLMRARDVVSVALEHLAADPLVFLHPSEQGCAECDDARKSTMPSS